jgi:rRNA pseudouridine-1189 N-methylase Emg1 (Nep1/Mra1 family)
MFTLVNAEAALELTAPSLITQPIIVKSAKKRGKPSEKIYPSYKISDRKLPIWTAANELVVRYKFL